jgi:site-specific DNA-methyltransferase (adenine-specific)
VKTFYEDEAIKLYHADSLDFAKQTLAGLRADLEDPKGTIEPPFDHVITDPPYSAKTHKGARTGNTKGGTVRPGEASLIDFASVGYSELKAAFEAFAPLISGWFIATVDYHHAFLLEQDTPKGLKFIRLGVWVKPNGAPQFSGDRPGMGWEAVAILHRDDLAPEWNGGGRNAVFTHNVERGLHPTQKPLSLISTFIHLFTNEGDTIFDPYAGSCTVGRAAKEKGRKAVLVEKDEKYLKLGADRCQQDVFAFGK